MKKDLILKKFFIYQFFFHKVHDFFQKFIISYFAWVICCDSTNAKWIFNGMIFQVIRAFSNPVKTIPSWRWKLKTFMLLLSLGTDYSRKLFWVVIPNAWGQLANVAWVHEKLLPPGRLQMLNLGKVH